MRTRSLTACAALLLSMAAPAFDIVSDGRAQTAIIVPDEALPVVTYAAQELQYHIRRATGCELRIALEREKPITYTGLIYLGETQKATTIELALPDLPRNGFVMRLVGPDLILAGEDGQGPAVGGYRIKTLSGTLFAVYEFLETQLGVRWVWPGELGEVIPETDALRVDELDVTQAPRVPVSCLRVSGRDSMLGWGAKSARDAFLHDQDVWMRRQRITQPEFISCAHSFTTWWKEHGKEHPDWFQRLPDGRRGPLNGDTTGKNVTMCVSNAGLQKAIVDRWVAKGGPASGTVIRLGENDTPGMCTCPTCRAWDAPQEGFALNPYWSGKIIPDASERFPTLYLPERDRSPSLADRYANFYMAVLNLARKHSKKARVAGFAYANYARPPSQTALDEDVIITLVPAFYWPWSDAKRDGFRKQWQGWNDAGARLFLRPNYTLSGHNMPIFYARKLAEDFSFAWRNGLIGTDFDSLLGAWANHGPNLYALGRLHARPDLRADEILDEYFAAFGPAQPQVTAYFSHWETLSNSVTDARFERYCEEENGGSFKDWIRVAGRLFPPEAMQKGKILLEKAAEAAAGDELARKRVRFLQIGLEEAQRTLTALAAFKSYEGGGTESAFRSYAAAVRDLETYRHAHEHTGFANLYYLAFRENRVWDRSLIMLKEDMQRLPDPWRFAWDPDEQGEDLGWQAPRFNDHAWLPIGTASAWEKQPVGIAWREKHGADFNGVAWYRTTFTVTPEQAARRVSVLFGAVDESCTVWVNGKRLLSRIFDARKNPNAWAEPFEIDISSAIEPDTPNTLAVRVEDRSGAGGIWKPVWINITDRPDTTSNLLRNPGFEAPLRGADNWYFISYKNEDGQTYTVDRDTEVAHSGTHAMRIRAQHQADGRLVQKIPDLDPNQLYRLITRVRTAPGFKGAVGIHIGTRASCKDTGGAWRELILNNIPAPEGKLYLGFWVSRCTGTVWLDDIELHPMRE
ncbi:MAG: DUF4838 domain-containing protein [Lentisphaerae bacterium]|nr:DUF4838 domain-containing protein [Lentisphaerota bacterium]MBT4821524.1 DUF4838 domain-containing protein [Lentisphaerota bacterium]MBT5605336.1 DUF4838 domain-containing protein [Lentisphaerota bacterium]MBT7055874.1 DUF4838 domain-containing protein [Lentisphaerota bacterium]MBT7840930.1 DUF4838 domain-containing protein [Lentisphaerota bacterium]